MKNHPELIEITAPFFISGLIAAVSGSFLPGWIGIGLVMLGISTIGGAGGTFGYWWVVAFREDKQKRQLAVQLAQARKAKGLTYEQVYNLTGIDVERLETKPESLSYYPGTLTDIAQELSILYGRPLIVGALIV
jgi:hypothetical protein